MGFDNRRGRVTVLPLNVRSLVFVSSATNSAASIETSSPEARPLARASSLVLSAASILALAVGMPEGAQAQVVCMGSGPFTCTGSQSTTFTVTAAQTPITFDSGTNITNLGGDAVDGNSIGALNITNQGTLIGGRGIVAANTGFLTVTNSGTIGTTGVTVKAVEFAIGGGTLINQAGGHITGDARGVDGNATPITVNNSGTITGGNDGVGANGAHITNQAGGTITGGLIGLNILDPVPVVAFLNTVTNAGTITGGNFSVRFSGATNVLTLQTGSVLNGTAQGSGSSSLVLQGTGSANNDFVAFTSLDVQAGGLWALNGSSAIGAGTVTSGTLVVGDGAHAGANLTGSVAVNSGGALAGQGTVTGNVTVASGGAIAPGAAAAFSTLNVTGNANFAAGSLFQVKTNAAGQNDKLVVGGAATLTGSTVQVLAQTGFFAASTPYTILHANGGFGGTSFANVTSNLAFLTPSLSYDTTSNNVVLTLTSTGSGGGGGIFGSAARTPNERAVAAALSASPPDSTLFTALLNQSVDGARQAFTALSGDVYATTTTVQADHAQLFRSAILGRLEQAAYSAGNGSNAQSALGFGGPELAYASTNSSFPAKAPAAARGAHDAGPHDLTFWTQALGGFGHINGDGNATGANAPFAGFLTGVDAAFGSATRAGLAAGYSHSDIRSGASGVGIDSAHFAAYAGHNIAGPLHARGGVSYTFDTNDSNRSVVFPGFLDLTHARFSGNVAQAFGEIGYGLAYGRFALEPLAGLAYVHTHQGTFSERGAASALNGAATDQDIGYSWLGVRAATLVPLANGTVLSPHVSAQWQHAFGDLNPATALAFQSTGTAFLIAGVPIAQDAALLQGGVDWRWSPAMKIAFDYQGTLAASAQTHLFKGSFVWNF